MILYYSEVVLGTLCSCKFWKDTLWCFGSFFFPNKGKIKSHHPPRWPTIECEEVMSTVFFSELVPSILFPEWCVCLGSAKLGLYLEISQKQTLMKFSGLCALIMLKIRWHSQYRFQPSHGCTEKPCSTIMLAMAERKFKVLPNFPDMVP